ncbi:NACHT domain-containing protein [Arthrobacter sp. AZCC_0090]|uniref:NACHT domain-containing protein n=1 Tax=Arthrobacter sp. AZCC_0090 TaxID=2735881 RepID=UPI00161B7A6F|nr:NACHT domain-containing protein [Arthrobacter sp. AZCC_0090]MBB6406187.1 hypothetical protein [Arthrobacter sp. AZCC_0090]
MRKKAILKRLLAGALVGLAAFISWRFIDPYSHVVPGSVDDATFFSTFLGLITTFVPVIKFSLIGPKGKVFESQAAEIRRQQIDETNQRIEELRFGLNADIDITFANQGNGGITLSSLVENAVNATGGTVIIGPAGSGKSYSAHTISQSIMRKDDRCISLVIPVGRWAPNSNFIEWLARYLEREYQTGEDTASALLTERLVIPIFDGLDEAVSQPTNAFHSVDEHTETRPHRQPLHRGSTGMGLRAQRTQIHHHKRSGSLGRNTIPHQT